MTSLSLVVPLRYSDLPVCNNAKAVNMPSIYEWHVARSALSTVAATFEDSIFCLKHLYIIQIAVLFTPFTVSHQKRLLWRFAATWVHHNVARQNRIIQIELALLVSLVYRFSHIKNASIITNLFIGPKQLWEVRIWPGNICPLLPERRSHSMRFPPRWSLAVMSSLLMCPPHKSHNLQIYH